MKRITPEENKKLLVEMLIKISKYFDENNIKYFLCYGTLLGAVRHKGFIPWDDDIDIHVPREDFLRLIHLLEADKEKLQAMDLELLEFNQRPKSYHKRFKIANLKTTMEEYGEMRSAVFIDIFPLDCFKSIKDAKRKLPTVKLLSNILTFCHAGKVSVGGSKGAVYKLIFGFNKLFGLSRMERFYEKWQLFLTKWREDGVVESSEDGFDYRHGIDAGAFADTVLLDFEGEKFKCPIGYDKALTCWYGDYMTPPPEGDRHAHESYVMYWKD